MFDCYRGKKGRVTGHTGFKGSWLCEWLLSLGADPGVRAHDGLTAEEWALAHPAQCTLVLEEVFPQNRR